jgi:hypothetical protein
MVQHLLFVVVQRERLGVALQSVDLVSRIQSLLQKLL